VDGGGRCDRRTRGRRAGGVGAAGVDVDAARSDVSRADRWSSSSARSATNAYDTWNYVRSTWLRRPATAAQIDEALAWLRERAPLRAGGPDFAAARGANLIVVQVESLQDFAVDFTVGGQE